MPEVLPLHARLYRKELTTWKQVIEMGDVPAAKNSTAPPTVSNVSKTAWENFRITGCSNKHHGRRKSIIRE